MMNVRLIDGWTFLHFIVAFVITELLISTGIGLMLIVIVVISYEVLEHSAIGDKIFEWTETERKEISENSIIDITVGLLAVYLAYYVV